MSGHTVTLDMEQVAEWYASGLSLRDIAARTGVGAKTVHRHMVNAGIPRREPSCNPPPAGHATVTPGEIEAIRNAVALCGRVDPVARQFSRSETTIRKVAGDLLEVDREAGRAPVRALHEEGLTSAEIARRLGWSQEKVRYAKVVLGLPGRRPADPVQVCALYRDLGTLKAVAATLKIGPRRVAAILKDSGIEVRAQSRRRPHRLDAHLPALRRAYLEDRVPVGELAARYGCKPTTLMGYLTSRGVQPRTRRLTAAEHDQVLAMHASGMTMAAIGRHFGVTGGSVRWHLSHQTQRARRPLGERQAS